MKCYDLFALDLKNRKKNRFHSSIIAIILTETTTNATAKDNNITSSIKFFKQLKLMSIKSKDSTRVYWADSTRSRICYSWMMILVSILNLFFLVLLFWNESAAFNLQDGVPISSNPLRDSYFGYTVVPHLSGNQLQ